jgi:hypothetical protein
MIPFDFPKAHIECPYGRISEMKPENFGINKYTNKIRDACQVNEKLYNNKVCSDWGAGKKKDFIAWWNNNCKDKK